MSIRNSRFLQACRREPVDATPVWFMRQAGRYQPEYRKIRERFTLLEICRQPELCAEVTMLPVQQLGVDAAILFSDISILFEPMGVPFEIRENVGPVVHRPVSTGAHVDALRVTRPEDDLPFVFDTIRLLARELTVPLIGFAGAPFTLASYMIEGGPSRSYVRTRQMLYSDPGLWHALMARITDNVIAHLRAQAGAGASALQIFDSWVGCLDAATYRRAVLPHMRRLFAALSDLDVPVIHFATHADHLLGCMQEAGGDVIGIDWRVPIDQAWDRLGHSVAVQGNLDPAVLLGPWEGTEAAALDILGRVGHRPGEQARLGHIFNLGHGVLPNTPVDQLKRLVDWVHTHTAGHGDTPERAERRRGDAESAKPVVALPGVLPSRWDAPIPSGAERRAVLLMAYGTPASLADVDAYFTHIRGGRRPSQDRIEALRERYRAIGGASPLTPITLSLARKLEAQLGLPVYVGMRHAPPFIAEAMAQMAADGVRHVLGVTLAPHYSRLSVGAYMAAAQEAAAAHPQMRTQFIESWCEQPLFIEAVARRVSAALGQFDTSAALAAHDGEKPRGAVELPDDTALLFTAHSLPERILTWQDPYPEELHRSCAAIAQLVGVDRWSFAYQSESKTHEPWLSPTLESAIQALHQAGVRKLVICPVGFVADHLEVLFDIDIEARQMCNTLGIELVRTESLNDAADFVTALAALVRGHLTDAAVDGAPERKRVAP